MAFSVSMVYADGAKIKGSAIIKVAGKMHTLSLVKCYKKTHVLKGKPISIFIIATHKSRKSKKAEPWFLARGASHTTTAIFQLSLDGGIKKGGIDYSNKLPFDSFKNNKLSFKGTANSIKKEGKKVLRATVPIEINVSCF